jgi:NO-binding membrane sensor protein with MHYT domain
MLIVSYSPWLVAAAAAVALMAAITGMLLTQGISKLPPERRQSQIVKAAIVLGGGVWSTHFVAMLALDLPVAVFYDPLYTLGSALIAILMAGAALLLMHFGPRPERRVALAGALLGGGVVIMHYVGMSGMRGCTPAFAPMGYVLSTAIAVAMGIGALKLAYTLRTRRALTAGAVVFALAILGMHFTAMAWTGFFPSGGPDVRAGLVSNDLLAILVVLAAFLICGAFLLTTATLAETGREDRPAIAVASAVPGAQPADEVAGPAPVEEAEQLRRVPYEQEGRTYFSSPEDIVAIQAEGHYTRLHRAEDQLFCPLAIAKLEPALARQQFMRTHRSYLVNLRHVRGFERRKDQAVCLFDPKVKVAPVPVSRSRVAPLMKALGL